MSPSLTKNELVYLLQHARPSLLVAHEDNIQVALDSMQDVGLSASAIVLIDDTTSPLKSIDLLISQGTERPPIQDYKCESGEAKNLIAFLCFSSGTTGNPKAVSISHFNVICGVVQSATHHGVNDAHVQPEKRRFRAGDVCSGVCPFYHIYGIVTNLHWQVYSAMTVIVTQKFKFETMLQSIAKFRITHLVIVPPQAVLLCKHPATKNYDLSSVRFCMVAAAPVTAELIGQLLETLPGIDLGQGYEACAAVTMFPVSQKVGTPGSAGQLVPGTIAKVVKPDGSLAGVGESGELLIQGGQITLGYYGNEAATKESWYCSGDEVYFNEQGDVFVTDRIKELIKVKGLQVAPGELEGHLLNHPDVADACVIGVPDEYAGEAPLAFVVLQPQIAKAVLHDAARREQMKSQIYNYVASAKSRHKWLTGGVIFVESIPKSPSGKILRRVLRDDAKAMQKPRLHL
ncbi:hypothetical protein EVJ58_g5824 [Rhodofomes roseus]|uniref:Phenylacetyl-CoA ligase n=1 Tax=Rhodofomes roseus TaxID=34475 RepID=A0A4Y9YBG0_9APHY|nr:hypothetical protein EVJ58_g5824 [Rhodofomes roseus]